MVELAPERLELRIGTRGDMRRLGRRLGAAAQVGDVVLLEGDLGAGKTFLSRAIARGLGVPPEIPICSPTFSLLHELPGRVPLLHVDLYRLDCIDELRELGLFERIGRDAVCVVEWGARFGGTWGPDRLEVQIVPASGSQRVLRLTATGPGAHRLLAACHAD